MRLLRNLQRLDVELPRGMDLHTLDGVPSLTSVEASGISSDSFQALAEHKKLWRVYLSGIDGPIEDMSPLFDLPKLNSLYLYSEGVLPDIGFLRELPRLKVLGMSRLHDTQDFSPISIHTSLRGIWLFDCPGLTTVNVLRPLDNLRALTLRSPRLGPRGLEDIIESFPRLTYLQLNECEWLTDIHPIARLPLTQLLLVRLPHVNDFAVLRNLKGLRFLWLNELRIEDLDPIGDLKALRALSLSGCAGVNDLTPLANLSRLRRLMLHDVAENIDLSPLRGLRNLTLELREGQRVTGAERLPRTMRIEWGPGEWAP